MAKLNGGLLTMHMHLRRCSQKSVAVAPDVLTLFSSHNPTAFDRASEIRLKVMKVPYVLSKA